MKGGSKRVIADDMIVGTENPIGSTKTLLSQINEFNKTTGNKSIFRNQRFLYAKDEISETETRKKIPFTIATRKIKYQRKNLTKEAKDVYSKTTQHWGKKLRKTQINGSIYHAHGLEELTSLKCPYYPKHSIDSTQSLSKYQWHIPQI